MIRLAMPPEQPSGTVTLVFSDIEGSTRLLHELGTEAYREALAEHRRIVREAYARYAGYEVDYEGDAFFYAFASASDAVSAVSEAMAGLGEGPIAIRVGIHTGEPALDPPKYVGIDVHFAARVMSSAHGGQVVLSKATAALVKPGDTVSQGLELLELGEHRLKDVAEAVPLYQLGEGSFPPLKTISNTNLPRPASSFLGREDELQQVISRIRAGARLVTLTGPGGTGKTRLALEAAASLVAEYKAGVFWIGLASLRDPALVTETIAQTLGAKDTLASHIGERELLLLLDNFEQVVEAAPALSELLTSCPHLTLLVTSRELLRVRGEVEYPVPPLAEPEAISLFCERAQLEPADEIGELCVRLDSLPLAVELAAARCKALTPAEILERLSQRLDLLKGGRDADPRQETLRATIQWSYELLSAQEQELFVRLSVFAGGCTLKAAEEVAGADLDTLQSLVEKSLLRFTEGRYWMLETIREYAGERLEESSDTAELCRKHAEWFLALAEEAEPWVENDPAWRERLEAEHDNLRAALDRSVAAQESEVVARLAGALVPFWEGGYVTEGRQRVASVLSTTKSLTLGRAKVLSGAALLARQSGDAAEARTRAAESRALYRELGDTAGAANATLVLGLALADGGGDFAGARELFEEGARLFRDIGDETNALWAARLLAWMFEELGDRERARELHETNLDRARALGNRQLEGQTLTGLASLAIDQGRAGDAVSLLKEVLRIDRELGAQFQTSLDLTRFARALAFAGGGDVEAAKLLSCAEVVREEMGGGGMPYLVRNHEEALAIVLTRLDEDVLAEAWQEGAKLTTDEAVALALASLD